MLELHYTDAAASARGQCSPGEDLRIDYDVRLEPGFNLVRVDYVALNPSSDGTLSFLHQRIRSVQAVPDDMHWFLLRGGH